MNSVDDLTPDCLGYAGLVYEQVLVCRNVCKKLVLLGFKVTLMESLVACD